MKEQCSCCGAPRRQQRADYIIERRLITVWNPAPRQYEPHQLILKSTRQKNYPNDDLVRPYVVCQMTPGQIESHINSVKDCQRKCMGDYKPGESKESMAELTKRMTRLDAEIKSEKYMHEASSCDISSLTWGGPFYTSHTHTLFKWEFIAWLEDFSNEDILNGAQYEAGHPLHEWMEKMKADKRDRIVSALCGRNPYKELGIKGFAKTPPVIEAPTVEVEPAIIPVAFTASGQGAMF